MADSPSLQAVMAAVLQGYAQDHTLNPRQWQVCHHVLACRTEALGGLIERCDRCAEQRPLYHACRDRHCPRRQRRASERWCRRQQASVLPVTYHNVVFTLPHVLNPWVQIHDRELYALLFESVWATLRAFGADPKRLDGQLGMTAVLHTWGQTLTRHAWFPVGRCPRKAAGIRPRAPPVRALSRHVRGGFVSRLCQGIEAGRFPRIEDRAQIDAVLDALMAANWVVYNKPCITHTETVVAYLGRYSHRTALSDGRILAFTDGQVDLAYKDYRDGQNKVMPLDAEELLRRYLLHVLPKGFMRCRHYGFLANRCRRQRLAQIRQAIDAQESEQGSEPHKHTDAPFEGWPCPACRQGRLRVVGLITPRPSRGG